MTEQFPEVPAILLGLALICFSAALALYVDRARMKARGQSFVATMPASPDDSAAGLRGITAEAGGIQRLLLRLPGFLRISVHPRDLRRAGLSMTPGRFARFQAAAGIAGALVGWILAGRFALGSLAPWLALILGAASSLILPRLVLRFGRHRRDRRFESQFANAIDAMSNALQAGLSLPQALTMIAREMPDPVGAEFTQVVNELSAGLSLDDALNGLLERVPLADVEIFVAAVQIQYRVGGNLSSILGTIAHTVRERLRIRGEVRVLTAQQRMGGYVVALAPVFITLALSVINPDYIGRLFQPGITRVLLMGAVFGVFIGFMVIRRITDIRV